MSMIGKGAILTVFGFLLAFSIYQVRLSRSVLQTTDNFNRNYIESQVHQAAVSAMNIGINKVWTQVFIASQLQVQVNQCSSVVYISTSGPDTVKLKAKAWRRIFDEENTAGGQQSLISDSMMSIFTYNIPFSRYFWFSDEEAGVYWISGDSVWGPVHTNGVLRTNGSPVFYGKVTAYRGISPGPATGGSNAQFLGGWEVGIYNTISTDMTPLVNAAVAGNGAAPPNTKSLYNLPTGFQFLSNGKAIRTVGANPPDTVLVSDIAPTGVIYCSQDVHVSGVFNGQLTIYSEDDIWIDDDIVYADDPNSNPDSDDILGLVANDNVIVADNPANNNNCNIQACIMAVNGKFTAQNYSGRPIAGILRITGSIVQDRRGAIGTFSTWTGSITHGFSKRYRYDPRLQEISPPYYPYLRHLHLVSWWE